MTLGLLAAAWLGGTLLGLSWGAAPLGALALAGVGVLAAVGLRMLRWPALPALLGAAFLLALARAGVGGGDGDGLSAAVLDGREVVVEGRIVDDPENAATKVRFRLLVARGRVYGLRSGGGESDDLFRGQSWLVYANPPAELVGRRDAPYFRYGDVVSVSGELLAPRPVGGFDYPAYLAAQGITATLFAQEVEVTGAAGARWRSVVYRARGRMADSLERAMPYPESALAAALLLGKREALPPEVVERFRGAGAAHLLAISGLHVGVLLAAVSGVGGWLLGRRSPAWLLAAGMAIWLYAVVAGAPPSAVRAAIMGTVYLLAVGLGRPSGALSALALAAALMTALSPGLIRQVSFQLSFAAVGGIALALAVGGDRLGGWRSSPAGWRGWLLGRTLGLAAVSAAATLATWPLVAAYFGELPLLGVPVSLLAVPAMAPAVIAAGAAAMGGLVSGTLGELLGWLAAAPAAYLIGVVSLVPGWTVSADWAGGAVIYIWYGGLGAAILMARRLRRLSETGLSGAGLRDALRGAGGTGMRWPGPRFTIPAAMALSIAAAILWARAAGGPDGYLSVHFFDIGQGDSILIVTPSGRRALIDGGPEADGASQALAGALPGGDRGLDLAVMTHPDADHGRGLLEVLDRYKVGMALSGPAEPDDDIQAQWDQRLRKHNITSAEVSAGYVVYLDDGVELRVLNPPPGRVSGDSNDNSVVFRLTYGEVSFLLTADIGHSIEERLLRDNVPLSATVLKVGHHGSRTATSQRFLDAVNPAVAVISVGRDNSYGHPAAEVVERLELRLGAGKVYRTDLDGEVVVVTDGVGVRVRTGG